MNPRLIVTVLVVAAAFTGLSDAARVKRGYAPPGSKLTAKPNKQTTTAATQPTAAPGTVTQSTSAPGTVTQSTGAPGTVTQSTVAPGTVTESTAGPGTVTQSTVAPGTVTESTAAPGTVTQSTAAPGTVTQSTTAPGTVTQSTAAPGTVTESTAAPVTVTQSTVAPATVTESTAAPVVAASTRKNLGAPASVMEFTLNSKRSKHGVPAMIYDSSLKSIAEQCADFHPLVKTIAKNGDPVKTPCPYITSLNQREMLWLAGNDDFAQPDMINTWYKDESATFKFDDPLTTADASQHFVQLIWAATTKWYCAISDAPNDAATPTEFLHVCIFDTAGDIRDAGTYKRNVKPIQ